MSVLKNIDDFIQDLFELDTIKTWSFIVTLFGDLDGVSLSGTDLREIMAPLSIKSERIRVALHRLKKDGWIVSQKSGREVTYSLSDQALKDTHAVYDDVYSTELKYPNGWQLLIVDDSFILSPPVISISRTLAIAPHDFNDTIECAFEIRSTNPTLPSWFENKIVAQTTTEQAAKLTAMCNAYKHVESTATQPQKYIIRLLILHHWRKIALRPTSWAHIGLLPEGVLSQCHQTITLFLRHSINTVVCPIQQ